MAGEHFRVKYEIGRFPAEAVKAEGKGGTDGFLFFSIVHLPDGGVDIVSLSLDGRTERPLSAGEQFKVWLFLTKRLAESTDAAAWEQAVAQNALDGFGAVLDKAVAEPLAGARKVEGQPN